MFGIVGGDQLSDHAAHRSPNDVRLGDAENVEQAHGVGGHVAERIGGRRLGVRVESSDDARDVGRPGGVQMLAQTDVAVVEPDHTKSALNEAIDELVGPARHLRAKAHDQQYGLRPFVTPALVLDADSVRGYLRHRGSLPKYFS